MPGTVWFLEADSEVADIYELLQGWLVDRISKDL